jgi:RNA polymerase sigma-70 factor (ECF subfamily)
MTGDDASLIRKALAGDRESLGMLVRKYQNATFAMALARVGDAVAAEEIVQDALIRACQMLGQLKKPDRFPAWLRSITRRQCAMWLRSRHRESARQVPLEEELSNHLSVIPHPDERSENTFDIATLISNLPPGLKAAAVLCLEEELAPAAAAALLGLKPGTLRKRLHHARARLQRQIVERAEAGLRLQLLPKDFAQRCACRCTRAQEARARKEVMIMPGKKSCGCGCTDAKAAPKTRSKGRR